MNTHQRRLGRKERKRQEQQAKARDKAARKRDIDRDMPYYTKRDLGRMAGDWRKDERPAVMRVRGRA